jgi:glycine cleavage system aminomethyltransferase T
VQAAENTVLVVDRSADVKYTLSGVGAHEWLDAHLPSPQRPARHAASLVALPGSYGQIEALTRALYWSEDALLLLAGPEQNTRVWEWLRRSGLPMRLRVNEVTGAHAVLELSGPRRSALLTALGCQAKGDSVCWIGSVPLAIRQDELNATTLLISAADAAAHIWRVLLEVGKAFGFRVGGHFAHEVMRIRGGVPEFGCEATPARLIRELMPQWKNAALDVEPPRTHRKRIMAAFSSPIPSVGFGGREAILCSRRTVGELTSRVRLPGWPATLALGLLDPEQWTGEPVETVACGKSWPLVPRATRWSTYFQLS